MRRRADLAAGAALAIYVTCFMVGTLSHARDFLVTGWRPYRSGVVPLDIFSTSLVGLDAAVVGLLLAGRRRAGLLAALVVMVADVAANAYASFVARMPFEADRLVLQALFSAMCWAPSRSSGRRQDRPLRGVDEQRGRQGCHVGAFVLLLAAIVAIAGRDTPLAQSLAAVSIAIVLVHALAALGPIDALAFLMLSLVVTTVVENIGIATGVPFGRYAFLVGAGLPHVGRVPLIVGPLYFGMGYPSWVIAELLLLGRIERPPDRMALFGLPIAASFTMVQWDVVMDPSGSTLDRAWVWFDGGRYFGVRLSNYGGWFLTTWLYFQAFALFQHVRRERPESVRRSAGFWAVPILLCLAAGLCHLPPLLDADARLVDGGGHAWSAADLRTTTVIVMLSTMLPTALLALARLRSVARPIRVADRG